MLQLDAPKQVVFTQWARWPNVLGAQLAGQRLALFRHFLLQHFAHLKLMASAGNCVQVKQIDVWAIAAASERLHVKDGCPGNSSLLAVVLRLSANSKRDALGLVSQAEDGHLIVLADF